MRFILADDFSIFIKRACFETFPTSNTFIFYDDSRACLRMNDYRIGQTGKEALWRIALPTYFWLAFSYKRLALHVYP